MWRRGLKGFLMKESDIDRVAEIARRSQNGFIISHHMYPLCSPTIRFGLGKRRVKRLEVDMMQTVDAKSSGGKVLLH
jgi:hypothetical protein